MEKKETIVDMKEKMADEKHIWIEDVGVDGIDYDVMGDRIITALEQFCGIKDTKFLYIRKEGHHLEVGKAEVEYKFKDNNECIAKAVCMV